MGDTKPKNRADLVERLEQRWVDVLNPEYIVKCCSAAWNRLWRCVEAKGSYLKPVDIVGRAENESDSD